MKKLANPFTLSRGYWLYSNVFILSLALIPLTLSNSLFMWTLALVSVCALGTIITAKDKQYGNPYIWGGFLLIALISIINGSSIDNLLLYLVYAVCLLAGFQLRNDEGKKLFSVLIIIEFIGAITMSLLQPEVGNGSFIDPINYNIATGLTFIALVLSYRKWLWWIIPLAIVGLYLTCSEEAVIVWVVFLAMILIKRDWSKKILLACLAVVICLTLYFGLHFPKYFYMVTSNQVAELQGKDLLYSTDAEPDPTRGRFEGYKLGASSITLLGHGFVSEWNKSDTIHNLLLRAIYDVGIIGALGLLLVLIIWMKHSPVYIVVILITMAMFDHFFWTQIGAWFWFFIGVSYSTKEICIYKHEKQVEAKCVE